MSQPPAETSGERAIRLQKQAPMRQVLGGVFAVLALGVILLTATGLLLSNRWEVKQEVLVAAAPERLYALVADLQSWGSWEAHNDDGSVHYSYEASDLGPHSVRRFAGAKGNLGLTRVVRITPSQAVELESEINSSLATAEFHFESEGGLTRVTWIDRGSLPRITGPFLRDGVEQRLGFHMTESLKRLKKLGEGGSATESSGSTQSTKERDPDH